MFKRKRKSQQIEKFQGVYSAGSYFWAIKHTKRIMDYSGTVNEKILVIEYVMGVIRKDIEADALTRYLYHPTNFYKAENYHLFPLKIFTEDGTEIKLVDDGTVKKVKLGESCIISYISKLRSVFESIVSIKKPFVSGKTEHYARYYKEIDVCYVWHNLHSASMGMVRGGGEITANQVSLVKAYSHLNTDGNYWLNAHTGENLLRVHDFRIAILYELSRMKYHLLEQQ